MARQLWETSGLGPPDMQAAILYDHFTPYVLYQLEELGFCERGEAKDFVRDGNIELGGSLPINTHGGQLGEAYLHGMNGIAEAVRLVRGTSVNQVAGARARGGDGRHRGADQRARPLRRSLTRPPSRSRRAARGRWGSRPFSGGAGETECLLRSGVWRSPRRGRPRRRHRGGHRGPPGRGATTPGPRSASARPARRASGSCWWR